MHLSTNSCRNLNFNLPCRTEVGRQAEEIVAKGDLLPDEFMLRVVASKLDQLRDKHWILDGFPRTIGQGELLDAHLRYVADYASITPALHC